MKREIDSLSVADVQAMLRLIGEIHQIGSAREDQLKHLLSCLCRLLEAPVGVAAELTDFLPGRMPGAKTSVYRDAGLRDDDADLSFLKDDLRSEPLCTSLLQTVRPDAVTTIMRQQLFSDRNWFGSTRVQSHHDAEGVDDFLWTFRPGSAAGCFNALGFYRSAQEMPFTDRDRVLLHLINSELGWVYNGAARPRPGPELSSLTSREREVLSFLLDGDSEKQVAFKLEISRHTVHEYVKSLYRQFGVSSRAELMSQFVDQPRLTPSSPRPRLVANQ